MNLLDTNPRRLLIFVTVVEHGSFTIAATRLHVTQPAVTAQIRQLCHAVGHQLLAREGRRMVATEAGTAVYSYAREVLDATRGLEQDLAERTSEGTTYLTIGGNLSYGALTLPAIVARFRMVHQGVRVSLREAGSTELAGLVRAGEVDVALIYSPAPHDLAVRHLGDDELVVVESARYPISAQGSLTLEQVAHAPFVRALSTGATSAPGEVLDQLLVQRGLPPRSVVMELATGVHEAVIAGAGLAIVCRSLVLDQISDGRLRMVDVPGYHDVRGIDLAWVPAGRRRRSRLLEESLDFFETEISHLLAGSAASPPQS